MSLNPLAAPFFPHYQFPSDPSIPLCNSTTMSFPFVQKLCGMSPSIALSHGPPIIQPITDGTMIVPLIQPKNPSMQDAETPQPPPGSSSVIPSSLQHQAQCLKATQKTIQQFQPTLEGRTTRPKDVTNSCPSTSE